MKVQSTHTVSAGRQFTFDTMLSPEALRHCIPGCQVFHKKGEGTYEVTMKVGIGAVQGVYLANVNLSQIISPESFRMTVEGKGPAGTIKGDGTVRLSETDGVTHIQVDGDAQVSGTIARVGQRLLNGAAKSLLGRFFTCMSERVVAC